MLALDTPDDDPRWAGFVEQSQLGFLEPQATEKQVEAFRELFRADGSRLRVVYDPSAALPHQPVATLGVKPIGATLQRERAGLDAPR